MKKTNPLYFVTIILAFVAVIVSSCSKSASNEFPLGQQTVSLYLTDAPAVYDQVNIDIKSVKILVDTSKNTRISDTCNWDQIGEERRDRRPSKNDSSLVWQDLGVSAGIYDVLKLKNGVDTLLANKTVVNGAVRMIKIELGTKHTVVLDSVSYPLLVPVWTPNYVLIKLNGHEMEEYLPRKSRLWLDFDIASSIVKERNGKYYLRPFFKCFTIKTTASISGKVTPMEARPLVAVFNGTDTAYALPNHDGKFKIRGLKEGTYSVYVHASNGYFGKVLPDVTVSTTKEVELGTITLQK
jgi:hypothetical protein